LLRSRRLSTAALGLIFLAGAICAQGTKVPDVFSPFVPQPLPQRALSDFDGDGRPDVALIQDDGHGRHVQVRLSGLPGVVSLETTVVSVIAADVDHDGDVDLIAAAPSGEVVTWLNDGRGRFTLQAALHPTGLSPATSLLGSTGDELMALVVTSALVAPTTRAETAVVSTHIRPPTSPRAFQLGFLLLPSLRAPPFPISFD
jgi:hypothetical protein